MLYNYKLLNYLEIINFSNFLVTRMIQVEVPWCIIICINDNIVFVEETLKEVNNRFGYWN